MKSKYEKERNDIEVLIKIRINKTEDKKNKWKKIKYIMNFIDNQLN